MKKLLTGSLAALVMATSFNAVALEVEDQVYFRKASYGFMAWNTGKIKAMLDGEAQWDIKQVQAAANAIAGVANSGMGALYGAGSDNSQFKNTRLKPDFFQNPEKAMEAGMQLNTAANELAKVAQTDDKAAIAKAFGAVGASCKNCHDQFRAK